MIVSESGSWHRIINETLQDRKLLFRQPHSSLCIYYNQERRVLSTRPDARQSSRTTLLHEAKWSNHWSSLHGSIQPRIAAELDSTSISGC